MKIKMKAALILAIALFIGFGSKAQESKDEKRAQIESKRVAFITERAQLTPKESEVYWPIANELKAKKDALRDDAKESKKEFDIEKASDAEIENMLRSRAGRHLQAEQLDLDYLDKFIAAIGARKYAQVQKAEKDFRREMLKDFRDAPRPERPERPERPQGNVPK